MGGEVRGGGGEGGRGERRGESSYLHLLNDARPLSLTSTISSKMRGVGSIPLQHNLFFSLLFSSPPYQRCILDFFILDLI